MDEAPGCQLRGRGVFSWLCCRLSMTVGMSLSLICKKGDTAPSTLWTASTLRQGLSHSGSAPSIMGPQTQARCCQVMTFKITIFIRVLSKGALRVTPAAIHRSPSSFLELLCASPPLQCGLSDRLLALGGSPSYREIPDGVRPP